MPAYFVGIDIGGTWIKAVAVDRDGSLIEEATTATEDADPQWADRVRGLCEQLETGLPKPASGIGVAAPGLANPEGSCINWMPGRLPGIEGLVWRDFLDRRHEVPVLNDAHAALLGEIWKGAAEGCRDVVLLTLGTGVGGAVICDGKLLRGHIGRAGCVGHISLDPDGEPDICKTPGSLEQAIGDCTVAERSFGRFSSTQELVRAYRASDAAAKDIWLRSVRQLAAGIASIVNVVDPQVVIIGGGTAQAGENLLEPLEDALSQFEWRPGGRRVELRLAEMGDLSGAYGAAYYAIQKDTSLKAGKE